MESTSETLFTAESGETAALDQLETKIIALVEQLKELRTLREQAEARAGALEEKIGELDATVNQLRRQNSAADQMQKSVRNRVESLLERLESIG